MGFFGAVGLAVVMLVVGYVLGTFLPFTRFIGKQS